MKTFKFGVISIFPELVKAVSDYGITAKANKNGFIDINFYNPRDYSDKTFKQIDDKPYGGGPGMVMQLPPLVKAVTKAKQDLPNSRVIFVSPKGNTLNNNILQRLMQEEELLLVAGRYEGVDQRFVDNYVDEEISIGDYVLSGGELAVMVLIDALTRLLPGVVSDYKSIEQDSFFTGLLDYPHYTRPENFNGLSVPKILQSGDHKKINRWRLEQALKITKDRRPDLLEQKNLSSLEQEILTKN